MGRRSVSPDAPRPGGRGRSRSSEHSRGRGSGGTTGPHLPRGVRARGRPGPSDHAAGSSGTVGGGAQAPGGAGRRAPGARMALALALGKGPAGRRRQPRAEWEAAAAAAAALRRLLASTSCIGASGAFRKRLALVVKGFLSEAWRRRRRTAGAPLGHTEARRPRPRGRAWRRAAGDGGRPARAAPPRVGAAARAAPGAPGGKLRDKSPTRRRVAWGGGRSRLPPARPRTGRWGSQELFSARGTLSPGREPQPYLPPAGA